MSGTGSVLVVLDGSAQDVATLDWATDEAAALGTGLTVAHLHAGPVTPDRAPARLPAGGGQPEEGVLDVAAGRVAERASWVPVTTCAVLGDPLLELLRLAQQSSRVVLGERRTGRMYVSLAGQVAAQTSRPAVVVRGRAGAAGPAPGRTSSCYGTPPSTPVAGRCPYACCIHTGPGTSIRPVTCRRTARGRTQPRRSRWRSRRGPSPTPECWSNASPSRALRRPDCSR
jgi:hypothetical protein